MVPANTMMHQAQSQKHLFIIMMSLSMKNNNFFYKKETFFIILFYFLLPAIYAQPQGIEEARTLYPDASAVYLNKLYEYKIYVEDGNLNGICNIHEQIFIN